MAEALSLPPDFEWTNPRRTVFTHRVSAKEASSLAASWTGLNQAEIDYLVAKVRLEYRRDRLFHLVGRNIERFRACQAELKQRGYWF